MFRFAALPFLYISLHLAASTPSAFTQEVKRLLLKEEQWHNDSLDSNSPIDRVSGAPCKEYEIAMTEGTTYVIDVEARSPHMDCLLRLKDMSGRQWASDDDGGQGFDARVVFKCVRAGKYILVATTFGGDSGTFAVNVRRPRAVTSEPYRKVDSFTGAGLQWVRGLERVERPFRTYPIHLTAGTTYRIEATAEDARTQPALLLRTLENWVRARADNSQNGRHAGFDYACTETGVYFVVVTAKGAESRGPFELKATALAPLQK